MNTPEVWIQIGGHVFKKPGNTRVEVPDAWVGLEAITGEFLQSTKTNSLGQYTFEKLRSGRYNLSARMIGAQQPLSRSVDVPSSAGEYDLTFS